MSLKGKDFRRGVCNGRAKLRKEIQNHFDGGQQIKWLRDRVNEQIEMVLPKVLELEQKYKGQRYQDIY